MIRIVLQTFLALLMCYALGASPVGAAEDIPGFSILKAQSLNFNEASLWVSESREGMEEGRYRVSILLIKPETAMKAVYLKFHTFVDAMAFLDVIKSGKIRAITALTQEGIFPPCEICPIEGIRLIP